MLLPRYLVGSESGLFPCDGGRLLQYRLWAAQGTNQTVGSVFGSNAQHAGSKVIEPALPGPVVVPQAFLLDLPSQFH